uniref:Uncharacterized protein n=1 Tax=Meloidogyne enterolobii TaxID=390850 RepID=A0A6V7TTI4_MELEN|nr:unnamed protein product [Meloidogyne enterolobii]
MWLFLLLMCVSYLHAVLHGGEGTSKPSSDHNEIEDSILQEYPKYANMDFSDGHLQALLKTSQNYPIKASIPPTERIEGIGNTFNNFNNMFSNNNFTPNINYMFNNNFNQRLQPTPPIEDMFFQSNPNCAK